MKLFGFNQVEPSNDPSNRVGASFFLNGELRHAPRGVAETIERLSNGPTHLNDNERGGAACAGIELVTGSDGRTRAVGSLRFGEWYGLPVPPKAPDRPAPTVTLFHEPYAR